MNLFRKKQTVQALAEVLEDGRAIVNNKMKNGKYNNYAGPEPTVEVAVRVQPIDEPHFEAKMKAGLTRGFLLKPGVRVLVKYQPGQLKQVTLDEDHAAILARNPHLVKKE